MKTELITSKNLLHVFKKQIVNAQELNKYFKSNPNTSRRIGALPLDFYREISTEERAGITKAVGDIFEGFSEEISNLKENTHLCSADDFNTVLNKLTLDLKKALKRNDIKSSYVNSGSFKDCYKLQVGNFAYALSIFKKYPIFDIRGYFRESHGKGNEPQNIFTAYKNYSHGRVCRPFLANLSDENSDGGFILSKFIESTYPVKKELGVFQRSRLALRNIDTRGNSINGVFIEAGGFIQSKRHIEDVTIRKKYQPFTECLDANVNLLKEPLANNVQSRLLEALEVGVDLFSEEEVYKYIKTLPSEEQKIARKLVKHLNRIDFLKKQSIEDGTFESIQGLLKDDFCEIFPFDVYSVEFSCKENPAEAYQGYPRLHANHLGVDNVPSLRNMLKLLEENYCGIEIDLTNYYSKEDVEKLLANHNNEIKRLFAYDYLKAFNL